MPELVAGSGSGDQASDETSEVGVACSDMWKLSGGENKDLIVSPTNNNTPTTHCRFPSSRSKVTPKQKRVEE
ncbi:hypothetical protein LINPERHAP1_LOCUS11841 [Linum perenne]